MTHVFSEHQKKKFVSFEIFLCGAPIYINARIRKRSERAVYNAQYTEGRILFPLLS